MLAAFLAILIISSRQDWLLFERRLGDGVDFGPIAWICRCRQNRLRMPDAATYVMFRHSGIHLATHTATQSLRRAPLTPLQRF
jgi:hypothetical protein